MFRFGVDYYPEHWEVERQEFDIPLMRQAGMNVVRMAEFAWGLLEPRPDTYEFDWLDRVLDKLGANGIQAVLGTPTASPAPWVMAMYPNAYRQPALGPRLVYGNRREYCPNHPGYRERSRKITRAMAEHYKDHPVVIGWQTDNEFGDRCYCETCQGAFQAWLQKRYGSLDALNAAWGTNFWSHVYTEWVQIPVAGEVGNQSFGEGTVPNPGLALDYYRFMSDSYCQFQAEQVAILREVSPQKFITHNFMGFYYDRINYFDLADGLDFISWDNYPQTGYQGHSPDYTPVSLCHDTMRGLKGQSFWVMESESGAPGWRTTALALRPGYIRLWTYQAIAHGADGMVYFRWRTARHGTEQYWHGILDHHGNPRRRYREVEGIGEELKKVGEKISGAESRSQVGMLLSYDSRFGFHIQPNREDFSYPQYFLNFYQAFNRRNIGVDVISPAADFSSYRLLVVPAIYVLDEPTAAKLKTYVENGGILLTTARSGVKDSSNAVVNQLLPGLLGEVCGVEVEEYDGLLPGMRVPLAFDVDGIIPPGKQFSATLWCDILAPTTAEVLATYQGEFYAGAAAICCNHYDRGQAIYLGVLGDSDLLDAMADWSARQAGVQPVMETPPGVEAVERWQGNQRILFLLNHTQEDREVALPFLVEDLLFGEKVSGTIRLEPLGVRVVMVC